MLVFYSFLFKLSTDFIYSILYCIGKKPKCSAISCLRSILSCSAKSPFHLHLELRIVNKSLIPVSSANCCKTNRQGVPVLYFLFMSDGEGSGTGFFKIQCCITAFPADSGLVHGYSSLNADFFGIVVSSIFTDKPLCRLVLGHAFIPCFVVSYWGLKNNQSPS